MSTDAQALVAEARLFERPEEVRRANLVQSLDLVLNLLEPQLAYQQITVHRETESNLPQIAMSLKTLTMFLIDGLALPLQCLRSTSNGRLHITARLHPPEHVIVEVRDNGQPLSDQARQYWTEGLPKCLPEQGLSVMVLPLDQGQNVCRMSLPAVPRPTGETVRILAIDDSVEMLLYYENLLTARGYNVDTVHDGYQGLIRLRKATYSVVLLDMDMPGVNGALVIRAIRQEIPERVRHLVVVSGAIETYRDLLEEQGVTYMHKPIERSELYRLIEEKLVAFGQSVPPLPPGMAIPPMDGL